MERGKIKKKIDQIFDREISRLKRTQKSDIENEYVETEDVTIPESGWSPRFIEAIQAMTEAGMTQKQMARALSIHVCTLELWIRTKPEVKTAIQRAKAELAIKVEKALIQLALGYEHEDTQFFMYKGEVIAQPYTKKYPPNAFAALKWLQVNDKARWTDTKQINIDANINVNNTPDMRDFSDEELLALEKMGMHRLATDQAKNNGN